jgi:hypothetical protein
MSDFFISPPPTREEIKHTPPISPEYLKKKAQRDTLLKKAKQDLQQKGFKILKLTKSFFNYVALKSNSVIFVKVYNPLSNEKFSEKNLQRFADKYGVDVMFISRDGAHHLFQSKTKRYINLKCYSCGEKSRVYLLEDIVCKHCGKSYSFKCWNCGFEFNVKDTEYCNSCNRFICPQCKSCGCNERALLLEWKKSRVKTFRAFRKTPPLPLIKTRYGYLIAKNG